MMDNFKFDMTSEGQETFKAAFALFRPPGMKVIGYRVDGNRLIFYWHESKQTIQLPFPMTMEQAADFAYGWLDNADYGQEPDHDGDNGRGWHLYCESWGMIAGDSYAFAAVEPAWAMYGK